MITVQEMNGCGMDCNEAAGDCLETAGLVGDIETSVVSFTWISVSSDNLTFLI